MVDSEGVDMDLILNTKDNPYINRLVQERRNSSVYTLELRLSCTNILMLHTWVSYDRVSVVIIFA